MQRFAQIRLLFVLPVLISGYLLPARFLFEEDLRLRAKINNWVWVQQNSLIDEGAPEGEQKYLQRATLLVQGSEGVGKIRIDSFASTQSSSLFDSKVMQSRQAADLQRTLGWLSFFILRDAATLESYWQRQGVDTQHRTLVELGGKVVYRLGDAKNHLYFHKDLLHPLGYRLQELFVHWEAVEPMHDGIFFPKEITIERNGQVVERQRILNMKPNQPLESTLFEAKPPITTNLETTQRIRELRQRYE